MKTVRNTTIKALRVALPLGKVLRLGPRMTGEIADRAIEHPSVARLVEAGKLEVVGAGNHANPATSPSGAIRATTQGSAPEMTARRRGDR